MPSKLADNYTCIWLGTQMCEGQLLFDSVWVEGAYFNGNILSFSSFKCGECGQMLKSRSNYKNHMRQHTGERPFKCDRPECGRTFVQRANYLKHLRWHSGIRPHGCSYCDKRFPTAYDMKLHINSVHTGAKPFECDICDSKFSQPSTLRVHRMRVHR